MPIDSASSNSRGRQIVASDDAASNFNAWFGESKAVDGEGRPLVLYHGTDCVFSVFGYGYDNAQYFSDNPEIASDYSLYHSRSDDPFPNVLPCYVSIRNPLVISRSDLVDMLEWDGVMDWTQMESVVADARARGYDGLHLQNIPDYKNNPNGSRMEMFQDQWVTFEPNQIKSAIGNLGTFDPLSNCVTDGHDCFKAGLSASGAAETARNFLSLLENRSRSPKP